MYAFSVCMSVYKNDKSADVSVALDSIINQSIRPDEIVLVVDGPISDELMFVLDEYDRRYIGLFNIIRLPINQGLGNALKIAIDAAKYELIARMDSDDIAEPTRFKKQLMCFLNDSELSIIGTYDEQQYYRENQLIQKYNCLLRHEAAYKLSESYDWKKIAIQHINLMNSILS